MKWNKNEFHYFIYTSELLITVFIRHRAKILEWKLFDLYLCLYVCVFICVCLCMYMYYIYVIFYLQMY